MSSIDMTHTVLVWLLLSFTCYIPKSPLNLGMLPAVIALLCLSAATGGPATLFDDKDKVIVLNKDDYKTGLYSGDKAHLFMLYSSWCGHCQRFAPTYMWVTFYFSLDTSSVVKLQDYNLQLLTLRKWVIMIQCSHFFKSLRELADYVHKWFPIVDVTGVDCVYDVDVCRVFNVRLPTLTFWHKYEHVLISWNLKPW